MLEKCFIPCNIIFSCLFSNYKSSTEEDHGQVLCWASNGLGEQIQPCVFRVVPLASPASPKDCRVIPNTFFTLSAEFSKDAFFSTLLVFLSTLLHSDIKFIILFGNFTFKPGSFLCFE